MRRVVLMCFALVGCAKIESREAVRGRFVDRRYTPDGVVERPTDLSTRAFRVYSHGRWYPESGLVEGAFDGSIYIEVPEGPYLLNVVHLDGSMTWLQREEHQFVDVAVRIGRPDAQPATNAPMQLQLDNLAPWGDSDGLYVNCYENGTEHYPLALDTPPAAGATQVRGAFDWASTYSGPFHWDTASRPRHLLDATAGDTLTVSRLAVVARAGLSVSRLTQIARGPASTQRDGEPSSFAGAFVDVPPTHTQGFTVDLPAIAAQLPDVDDWGVSLSKGPSSIAFDRFGPSLLSVGGEASGAAPVTFTESYGDPFDASWQLVAAGAYGVRLDPPLLSDGRRRVTYPWAAYATEKRHLAPGADFTLGPTLAFVTSASLDGHPLTGDVRVTVTNGTETSSSSAYRLLGPFRLVQP